MTESHDDAGAVVDHPKPPFAIPIDAFSVNPLEYRPFLPDELSGPIVAALNKGEAVLGQRSAALRGIGAGGSMTFVDGQTVKVGYVAPDEAVGWSEMLVSRDVGAQLGISDDRYLLAQMAGRPTDQEFETKIESLLPAGTLLRVAAPHETQFVRVASGVDPPIVMKEVFGEFSAYPHPDDPAQLTTDPGWFHAHIETRNVPLLGNVTCNKALFPMLIAAPRRRAERRPQQPDPHGLGVLRLQDRGPQSDRPPFAARLRGGGGHQRAREPLRQPAHDGPPHRPDLRGPRLHLGRQLPDPRRHALRIRDTRPARLSVGFHHVGPRR